MSFDSENVARPTLGSAGSAYKCLPFEDFAALRVRETPARVRMGWSLPRWPHQRHPSTAHIMSSVSPMSALFPPESGLIQRKVSQVSPSASVCVYFCVFNRCPYQLPLCVKQHLLRRNRWTALLVWFWLSFTTKYSLILILLFIRTKLNQKR